MNHGFPSSLQGKRACRRGLAASVLIRFTALFHLGAFLCLASAHGSGVVTNCLEAELDQALEGGGPVRFLCDGTIYFTAPKPITNAVVIDATGRSVTFDGGNTVRLFSVSYGASLALTNVTLANGFAQDTRGGAISNAGLLFLERCNLVSNRAVVGGAVYNRNGIVTANASSFLGNSCNGPPKGGMARGGAIFSSLANILEAESSLFLTNCTFAFNRAVAPAGDAEGAAIMANIGSDSLALVGCTIVSNYASAGDRFYVYGAVGVGAFVAEIIQCTFVANAAVPEPWQIHRHYGDSLFGNGISVSVVNSIFALGPTQNCDGYFKDLGHNLNSDAFGSFDHPSSRLNTDPKLGPLRWNGGPTLTMRPLPGSPAIGAGDPRFSSGTDQRGFERSGSLDIGAVEYQSPRISDVSIAAGPMRFSVLSGDATTYFVESASELSFMNWTQLFKVSNAAPRETFSFNMTNKAFFRVRADAMSQEESFVAKE